MQCVPDFLLNESAPEAVALFTLSGDYTYRELREAAKNVASYLQSAGARKGDRVLLAADNSFFWVAAYLGILKAGLVCVPLASTISGAELSYILQSTEAQFVFLQSSTLRAHQRLLSHLSIVADKRTPQPGLEAHSIEYFPDLLARNSGGSFTPPDIEKDDLAVLIFTSGSTGQPKAVMVSHNNIIANTASIAEYLKLTKRDRILAVLPFYYCFGSSLLHTHLRVGGSVVLEPRFMYPERVLDRIIETESTGFAGVPSHFHVLLRSSSIRNRDLRTLRYVQQAGGYMAPKTITELQQALPETKIFVMYGQTEATARLSYLPPERLADKIGSIGKGIPGVQLRVLTEDGRPVSTGEIGEIVAEGENVTLGYWRDPEETARSFRHGRLYTGDLATVDSDGFIYIAGRAKEFIKSGGKRVGCRQLEQEILEFEGLTEVAVIGVPDDLLGEAVKAFVVPSNSESDFLERLYTFCRRRMQPAFVPRDIVLLNSIPKNEYGKVSKPALRQL